ncbi:MAG: TonB-dependent receptor [candidate division KSB1 bacterium]|nr:TonB-dependent receptor [candidate division KSB1 bacterium]
MNKLSAGAIVMGFILRVAAQEATIVGRVVEAESGRPLPGANVFIIDTFLGSSTTADGRFTIRHVPAGEHRVKAAYIGYRSETATVRLSGSQTVVIDFSLKSTPLVGEQVVVTGSRQPENLASAAGSIHVLSKEDLQRRASFRIDEALTHVAGVTLIGEQINIRGGSGYNRLGGSRALVLLDDVPMLTGDLGETNWNLVPITEVELIEVSKGASSALYGSGALSGVIAVRTKQPSLGNTISFRQTVGVYDRPSVPQWRWTDELRHYEKTDFSWSNTYGRVGVRLAATRHVSTGDRENGQFTRWYLTGKAHAQLPGNSTLTLFSTYSEEDRGLFLQWLEQDHALQVPAYDRGKTVGLKGYVGYAVWNKLFSPTLALKVRLSFNQQLVGIPFDLSGTFAPAAGLGGELQWQWKPHPNHSLAIGLDYKYDAVESSYYGRRTADGLSPYIQEIWKLSELLQINAGLRWDNYVLVGDSIETQISPKIGFSWQPISGTVLHGSLGRAFRAATVVERFLEAGSSDFRWRANPALEPERSTLLDIGLRQNVGERFSFEAACFFNRFDHLIEPTLFNDLTAQFINTPAARIDGLETEMRFRLWKERLELHANAVWMNPREIESGEPLVYRPRFTAAVTPALHWRRLSLEADYRYVARLPRVAVYPLDERVAMKLVDIRATFRLQRLLFRFLVRNALNYNYTVSERVLGEIRNYALVVEGHF